MGSDHFRHNPPRRCTHFDFSFSSSLYDRVHALDGVGIASGFTGHGSPLLVCVLLLPG